jgi:hypothetical protein
MSRNSLASNAAVIKAEQLGHALEYDPPAAITAVYRWTCKNCGAAALVNGTVAYGSALTEACAPPPTGEAS